MAPTDIKWRSLGWGVGSACGLTLDTNQVKCFGSAESLMSWRDYLNITDWITWQMGSRSGCGLRADGSLVCFGYSVAAQAMAGWYCVGTNSGTPYYGYIMNATNIPASILAAKYDRLWMSPSIACASVINEDRIACWGTYTHLYIRSCYSSTAQSRML